MKTPSAKELNRFIEKDSRRGWMDIILKYGEAFEFQKMLITANPAQVDQLLRNRNHTKKRSRAYTGMARLFPGAKGILFQDGDIWNERIKQVMPVFTKINVHSYHQFLYEKAYQHAQDWQVNGQTEDVYLDVTNLGVDVLLKLGYGLDTENPLVQSYGKALRDYKLSTMYEIHRIDKFGINLHNIREVGSFIHGLWELRKKMGQQKKLLQQIIENNLVQEDNLNWINIFQKVKMPFSVMTGELNHIYGAFNAIDYVLTCALYALNAYPENCKLALQELKDTRLENLQNSKNFEKDFPEIIAFMRESFRFFPVAIGIMRQTGEALNAAKKNWSKGSEVMILIQAMHFNPAYWDTPNDFNPARFKVPLKEPKAYIPFLLGPRRCIGQHLAESHFLFSLLGIFHGGFPKVDPRNFEVQPYFIPRLAHKLKATF